MKRKEARERLLRVGIIDPDNDGELSDQYCTKKERIEKQLRREQYEQGEEIVRRELGGT